MTLIKTFPPFMQASYEGKSFEEAAILMSLPTVETMHTCIFMHAKFDLFHQTCNVALPSVACTASYKAYYHVAVQHNTVAVACQSQGRSAGQQLVHSVCLWCWEKHHALRVKTQDQASSSNIHIHFLTFCHYKIIMNLYTLIFTLCRFCTQFAGK